MAGIEDYANEPWPEPEITKDELNAWESSATPGQKKAFDQAWLEYKAWITNPDNAWFGNTVNKAVLQGKLREIAEKYNVELRLLSYKYLPWERPGF